MVFCTSRRVKKHHQLEDESDADLPADNEPAPTDINLSENDKKRLYEDLKNTGQIILTQKKENHENEESASIEETAKKLIKMKKNLKQKLRQQRRELRAYIETLPEEEKAKSIQNKIALTHVIRGLTAEIQELKGKIAQERAEKQTSQTESYEIARKEVNLEQMEASIVEKVQSQDATGISEASQTMSFKLIKNRHFLKDQPTAAQKAKIESRMNAAAIGKACFQGVLEVFNGDFCWKKSGDAGVIPTQCAPGYFRSLALCYKYCEPGYYHVLGVCWAQCENGYADHGATCYKSLFRWYFKHSYIASSYTNFDSKAFCEKDHYKPPGSALCYRDCESILMKNCGIGACSSSGGACAKEILNMMIEAFMTFAQAIILVVTMGGSSAISAQLATARRALTQIGQEGAKAALRRAGDYFAKFTAEYMKKWVNMIVDKAKKFIPDQIKGAAKDHLILKTCEAYATGIKTKVMNENKPQLTIKHFDFLNIYGSVEACSDTSDEAKAIGCAKNIMDTASKFDPTGLISLANAFTHPTCKGL